MKLRALTLNESYKIVENLCKNARKRRKLKLRVLLQNCMSLSKTEYV